MPPRLVIGYSPRHTWHRSLKRVERRAALLRGNSAIMPLLFEAARLANRLAYVAGIMR